MPASTTTATGWCPFATRVAVPESNYSPGHTARLAVVMHIMDGGFDSSLGWFQDPAAQVSSHFQIAKDGRLAQCVSIEDTAYANGLSWRAESNCWHDPEGHALGLNGVPAPTWTRLAPPTNPNWTTISIEREGSPDDPITPAMHTTTVRLLRWLADTLPSLRPYQPHVTLIGHCDVSPVSRHYCPGPHTDLVALARAVAAPSPTPPPTVRYRARAVCPVWTARRPDAPLAVDASGLASLNAGGEYPIDDVTDGYAHLSSGIGFVPIAVLERV